VVSGRGVSEAAPAPLTLLAIGGQPPTPNPPIQSQVRGSADAHVVWRRRSKHAQQAAGETIRILKKKSRPLLNEQATKSKTSSGPLRTAFAGTERRLNGAMPPPGPWEKTEGHSAGRRRRLHLFRWSTVTAQGQRFLFVAARSGFTRASEPHLTQPVWQMILEHGHHLGRRVRGGAG